MNVHCIDLDNHFTEGKLSQYEYPFKFFQESNQVLSLYLPVCDEAHELIGNWLIEGTDVNFKLMNQGDVITFDMREYGHMMNGYYNTLPPVYYLSFPGWELIAEHNCFALTISVYFRPVRKN